MKIKLTALIFGFLVFSCNGKETAVTDTPATETEQQVANEMTEISDENMDETLVEEVAEAPATQDNKWPTPDGYDIDVPISDLQIKYCSPKPNEENDIILTFAGEGLIFFEIVEGDFNKVLRVFQAQDGGNDKIIVDRPENCANCASDYTTSKYRFDGEDLLVTVGDGEKLRFTECML